MGEIKYDKQADGVGFLYRAAFYLAKGDAELAVAFLKKALNSIKKDNIQILRSVSGKPELIKEKTKQLYWAEKILDEYKRLYFQFFR